MYSATFFAELFQELNTIGFVPAPVALTRFPLADGSFVPVVRSQISVVPPAIVWVTVKVDELFVYVSPRVAVAAVTVNLNKSLFHKILYIGATVEKSIQGVCVVTAVHVLSK